MIFQRSTWYKAHRHSPACFILKLALKMSKEYTLHKFYKKGNFELKKYVYPNVRSLCVIVGASLLLAINVQPARSEVCNSD